MLTPLSNNQLRFMPRMSIIKLIFFCTINNREVQRKKKKLDVFCKFRKGIRQGLQGGIVESTEENVFQWGLQINKF